MIDCDQAEPVSLVTVSRTSLRQISWGATVMRLHLPRVAVLSMFFAALTSSPLQGQVDHTALAPRWSVRPSAGPASVSIVGISSRKGIQALTGVGHSSQTPLTVRVDAMAETSGSASGCSSLNANAVRQVTRIASLGTVNSSWNVLIARSGFKRLCSQREHESGVKSSAVALSFDPLPRRVGVDSFPSPIGVDRPK